jgi:quercetin dioxygenase-like cupin family protein
VGDDRFDPELGEEGGAVTEWGNGPGYRYSRHYHAYRKLLRCLQGSIVLHTDDGDIALRAGDETVIAAGVGHSATVGEGGVRCAEVRLPG